MSSGAAHMDEADPSLARLLADIRACRACPDLPLGPRPVVQAASSARLRIVGQAPGRKVHDSGIPWNDASGIRLRDWLGLSEATFWDAGKVAITPMSFCYPGQARSGDNPPSRRCAPLWHGAIDERLPHVRLTLLVGQHAIAHYLGDARGPTLGDTVSAWRDYLPAGFFPVPHPSPRNQPWMKAHPWFEAVVVPQLREVIGSLDL